MLYFIGQITETIDGYESTHTVPVAAKDQNAAQKELNKQMKTWRDEDGDCEVTDDGYEFEGGCILVNGIITKEIPKSDYDVLIRY